MDIETKVVCKHKLYMHAGIHEYTVEPLYSRQQFFVCNIEFFFLRGKNVLRWTCWD